MCQFAVISLDKPSGVFFTFIQSVTVRQSRSDKRDKSKCGTRDGIMMWLGFRGVKRSKVKVARLETGSAGVGCGFRVRVPCMGVHAVRVDFSAAISHRKRHRETNASRDWFPRTVHHCRRNITTIICLASSGADWHYTATPPMTADIFARGLAIPL